MESLRPAPQPPDDDTFYELGGELLRQSGHRGLTDHIARHDPAQVLADVEAKRAVLDFADPGYRGAEMDGWWEAHEQTVRLLASAYRHRPGWNTDWE